MGQACVTQNARKMHGAACSFGCLSLRRFSRLIATRHPKPSQAIYGCCLFLSSRANVFSGPFELCLQHVNPVSARRINTIPHPRPAHKMPEICRLECPLETGHSTQSQRYKPREADECRNPQKAANSRISSRQGKFEEFFAALLEEGKFEEVKPKRSRCGQSL